MWSVAEVPSSPEISEVQTFSSTAVVEFDEPESLGGVPIIKYKVEWRIPGQDWTGKEYKAEEGESQVTAGPHDPPSLKHVSVSIDLKTLEAPCLTNDEKKTAVTESPCTLKPSKIGF